LSENKLWFSNPQKFNDPFELRFCFNSTNKYYDTDRDWEVLNCYLSSLDTNSIIPPFVSEEMLASLREHKPVLRERLVDDASQIVEKHLKEQLSYFGIASLSNNPENDLMWSYYASGHRGFMVTYDCRSSLLASQGIQIHSIDYRQHMPEIDLWKVLMSDCLGDVFSTKSLRWAHEQEIRLINKFDQKFESEDYGVSIEMPDGLSVKKVTIGCAASTEVSEEIERNVQLLANNSMKPVELVKLRMDNQSYVLDQERHQLIRPN
jgi:hypothetical protein